MYHMKTLLSRVLLSAALMLGAGAASGATGYHVTIDTRSLLGSGYLDLTLSALAGAAPASATLSNFTGSYGATTYTQGTVAGGIGATLTLTNGDTFNEWVQGVSYGGWLGFDVVFNIAATGSAGSTFGIALLNASLTDYVAGTGPDFVIVDLMPGAVPAVYTASPLASVSAVPEAGSAMLLCAGMALLALLALRRRRQALAAGRHVCAGMLLAAVAPLAAAQVVTINPATTYQTIRGFGGFNGVDWIADLTTAQVDTAFGNGAGQIGLSLMRMRVAPDSSDWQTQVATAQLAKAKGVTLFATPWSPPASMKTNGSVIHGRLATASYADYATHLLNFASFMQGNGAPLYAISIQNEPDLDPSYEGCAWNSAEFISFLSSQGSRFGALKVMAPESYKSDKALGNPVLNDASAEPHLDIVSGHLYGTVPSEYVLAGTKGKEVWMTEHYTDTSDANQWSAALPVALEIHHSMVAKYNAYVWWYIRRSYGLITEDGLVSKRGHVMAQFAKYIRPGYTRIAATAQPYTDVYVTAYKNSSGKIVVVAINNGSAQRQLQLTFSSAAPATVQKYRTSSSASNEYAGQYTVSAGVATAYIDPGSVNTFVSP